jgi:hypothetical protein
MVAMRREEGWSRARKTKSPGTDPGLSNQFPGDVLLSHAVYREVPSGLKGLTAVFGMGTGVAPSLRSPGKSLTISVSRESCVSIRALNILWSSRTAD